MNDSVKQRLKDTVLFKLNKYSLISMIIAIGLNVAGHYLAYYLKLPFWLDMIGTMFVAIQLGPIAGAIVGILSQLIFAIPDGIPPAYLVIGIATGAVVGFFFPRKNRDDRLGIVSVAILAALISTILCTPFNLYYYKGYTGNTWGDALFKMLSRYITSSDFNAFLSEGFVDLPDRVISIFLALYLVDFEETKLFKKKKSITSAVAAILVLFMAGNLLALTPRTVNAYDFESGFETVTYGSDDGILTAEVNAVTQTRDGYIWVGTYSGLYKYTGVKFEPAAIDSRIRNVMDLFVDSRGRLWIGTNDSGAFCYDPETGVSTAYSTLEGLDANSIRTINEDTKGNIYLGTVRSITKVNPEGKLKTFTEWEDVSYCISFASLDDGSIVGVTNGGILFLIKDDLLLSTEEYGTSDSTYYETIGRMGDELLVGTTGHEIVKYKVTDGNLSRQSKILVPNQTYFNKIMYSSNYNGFFYCAENGFGFIDAQTYHVTDMTEINFNGSASDVCIDNQGNIWFASNKHGLMKYSSTPFRNVFKSANIEGEVVNAVLEDNGLLYVGMDNGLKIVDTNSNREISKSWLKLLDNVRVRHIMKDSKGNLWISTYGPDGLIKVDPQGNTRNFNEQNGGMLGGRMRSSIELSDGRILVASNMGLTFLKDDTVVATIGQANGLNNQYILSMYERDDGSILAASDGDGIYIIKNDRVSGHIGTTEGLDTAVVLRIIKGTKGYFYVTSNAIYYDGGDGVKLLENYPYSNNFDILISDDGTCWIPSSAGLYLVNENTLIEDGEYICTLLNHNWGLITTFTANSWNVMSNGKMYLCCTDGVRALSIDEYLNSSSDYQVQLESIGAADKTVYETDGKFVIPATSGRISFHIAINNYSLTNPLIHYFLEGTSDKGITCYQNEITPLEFTDLDHGDYKLHIQILNEATGEVEREEIFEIEKQAMMYEKLYFRLYLFLVCSMIVCYVIWLFYSINKRAATVRGLQKEISTDPMTGLYNKAASERVLTKICSEDTGILLMIDLDSFKLVNDIYGHDMGDRILIRFAELIREAVGEGNMGGRLGGDEFIGFIKDTMDEDDVERITKHLNKEIVKSAKEYMGEDMNIPLGASIGAVRVPVEGRDFGELFRHADKALYIVKQNGKHGYAFYQKSSDNKDLDQEESDKNNLAQIKKIIGERNEGKGAYLVNFDKFQTVYKFLNRNNKVTNGSCGFARISIECEDGSKVPDEIKDSFEDVLITNLKKNDVVSRYSGNFFVIFSGSVSDDSEVIISRLQEIWKSSGDYAKYQIKSEFEQVG